MLNVLLFLPLYAVFGAGSTFWPSFTGEAGDGSLRWTIIKLFVIRQNADVFRLSIEWVLLLAAWVWLRPLRKSFFRYFIVGFFIFGFLYNCYDSLVFAIYNDYPNLYDDLLLLISGFEGLTRHIGIPGYLYVLVISGFILFFSLCAWLIWKLTAVSLTAKLNRYSHLLLLLMVIYAFAVIWEYTPFLDHPRIIAGSLTAKVYQNGKRSLSTLQNRKLLLQASDTLFNAYDYDAFNLQEKPDIYIIFIESYGDALYQFEELSQPYLAHMRQVDSQLAQAGWQTASIRSEAPIRGGKSWLSYASFLFGLRLDDEAQYDVMLNAFQDRSFPHLGHYLKNQGYDYQRITPLLVTLERDVIAWEKTRRFLGYDTWLFLNDMDNFSGPVYGWGPSPPDQYTLSFLRAETEAKQPETPHMFFYITHNSHVPWVPPPEIASDWRTIATAPPQPPPAYNPYHETKEAYLQSILYEIEMVKSVVLNGPDDAIYVIVGDHQPPLLAFSDYEGAATPLHIVTQNQDLIDSLAAHQFQPGLSLSEATIKHEGFYSLFMQALLTTYADYSLEDLPPIRPDGLDLKALAQRAPLD